MMTTTGKPYNSRERDEAVAMRAAAEQTSELVGVPREIQAAIAHVFYAAALELDNGRPLSVEVRRAARHLLQAVTRAAGALGTRRGDDIGG